MAAKFPQSPTPQEQKDITEFVKTISLHYPCEECAGHFREFIAKHPIKASTNLELSIWLCKAHNEVNKRNNKDLFPCNADALKERWGECGCFAPSSEDSTG